MTDHNDRFDDLLQDALRSYNRPPDDRSMPLDDMWRSIELQAWCAAAQAGRRPGTTAASR